MPAEVPSSLEEKELEAAESLVAEAPPEGAVEEAEPASSADETSDGTSDAEGDPAAAEEGAAEGPHRRRELREFEITGSVTVRDQAFALKNWSSSGFAVSDCKDEFEENERVDIDFTITLETGPLAFSCKAIIVRSDPESGDMAGAFVEMRREDRVAVANYFEVMESEVAPEA